MPEESPLRISRDRGQLVVVDLPNLFVAVAASVAALLVLSSLWRLARLVVAAAVLLFVGILFVGQGQLPL